MKKRLRRGSGGYVYSNSCVFPNRPRGTEQLHSQVTTVLLIDSCSLLTTSSCSIHSDLNTSSTRLSIRQQISEAPRPAACGQAEGSSDGRIRCASMRSSERERGSTLHTSMKSTVMTGACFAPLTRTRSECDAKVSVGFKTKSQAGPVWRVPV